MSRARNNPRLAGEKREREEKYIYGGRRAAEDK